MITLRPIAILDDNMRECIELKLTKEQQEFVAHNVVSLAQAYAMSQEDVISKAVPYAIYANDTMVGFIMYGYFTKDYDDSYGEDHYYFWRFMVDIKYQGKGYGKAALLQLLDEIKSKPHGEAEYCYVSYEPKNVGAKEMYDKLGFAETGQIIDGETVSRLKI